MATKKRVTQYQYEPPITPRHWSGDELNYAIRLSQTLDDIYNKYSALRTALNAKVESGGGGGITTEVDPTVPAWAKQPNPPKAPVTSVNGQTGDVMLTLPDGGITVESDPTVPSWAKEASPPTYNKSDVGLGNVDNVRQYSASNPPPYPVVSVNGQTGAVTIDLPDGGITEETDPTVPSWAKAASKPSYTKSEVGLGNVDNVRQYSTSNPPPYPVTSVNGKTGAVTIELPEGGITEETDPTVPDWAKQPNKPTYSKSDVGLGNVANVLQYSASNPPPYPVTSVNGQTGAVTIEVGGSTGKKTHTVTMNTSFVNSGSITAYSSGGVLVVGGYIETKKTHAVSTANTICTISGVQVSGLNYAAVANHNATSEKTFTSLLLTENGSTRVQLEGAAYSLSAYSWINFTLVGIVA